MGRNFCFFIFVYIFNLHYYGPRVLGTPIVGGYAYYYNHFKYHVSLHKMNLETGDYTYFCGGTIIHVEYVLTAAHCFMRIDDGRVQSMDLAKQRPKIIAGTHKREGPGTEEGVAAVFVPKTYESSPNMRADIAVVQLRDNLDVAERDTLQIMNLGEAPPDKTDEIGIFCGFGSYDFVHFSEIIRYLVVKLLPQKRCPELHICAKSDDDPKIFTACNGDDGGGLIFGDRIVGVYSYGTKNCIPDDIPIVFTSVSPFRDQIDRAIKHADYSGMHVLGEPLTPHHSPIHQAGPSSPHNEASSSRQRKKGPVIRQFWIKNKSHAGYKKLH